MPVKKKINKKKKALRKITPKKKTAKKALRKKKISAKKPALKKVKEKVIGIVTHYFPKVRAAVVKLKAPLKAGDTVKIKGHTTDFTQNIASLQIDHIPVSAAKKGQEIGMLVDSRVREHDIVCKER